MFQYQELKIYLFCMVIFFPGLSFGKSVIHEIQDINPTQAQEFVHNTGWGLRPMTESEFTSSMCVLGATAGLALTYMVGPNEIIMLVVGGVVVPSSPSVLFVSLFGTMAAAGCTIGASSTPGISWLYQRYKSSK